MSAAISAVLGVSEVIGSLLSTSAKLVVGARQVDDGAAERMVALMRGRVAQDSGRLYNGITAERIPDGWRVQASAIDPDGRNGGEGADYASYVEEGTIYTEPQPFFWPSANEVLEERELEMRRITEGLSE